MKKSLLLGLVTMAVAASNALAQGTISLDNYNTSGPYVTLGSPSGPGLGSSFTAGFYFALGNVTGSVSSDPTLTGDPTTFGAFTKATGLGSTAIFNGPNSPAAPGAFLSNGGFAVPGTAATGGNTITVMVIAYNGPTYDTSSERAHSTAFTMVTTANTALQPTQVGVSMPAFFVPIPEPSLAALASLGGMALLGFYQRKR